MGGQAVKIGAKSAAQSQASPASAKGSKAVRNILRAGVQPKLKIGAVNDPAEIEADRVADQVMRMPAPLAADAPPAVPSSPGDGTPGGHGETPPTIRRKCSACDDEKVQRKETKPNHPEIRRRSSGRDVGGAPASAEASTAIKSLGSGSPLPASERSFFEPRFGQDLSGVRIHTGSAADSASKAINARAFSLGNSIAFASGEYQPGTYSGRSLMAHEITHTLQGGSGVDRSVIRRTNSVTPIAQMAPGEEGPPGPLDCVATTSARTGLTSSESFVVSYTKDVANGGRIRLRQRDNGDAILHEISIPATPNHGTVTFPSGISISNINHYFEIEMIFLNSSGTPYGTVPRAAVKFNVCTLNTAGVAADDLFFAQMLFAEGVDIGEFRRIRDLIYNRVDWVFNDCVGDARSFCAGGDLSVCNLRGVMEAPNQFASVLGPSAAFTAAGDEFSQNSGPCDYTTAPRANNPTMCRRLNEALIVVAEGDQNTHNYLFFRSDTRTPSPRAINMSTYTGGNNYWEISGCS